MSQAPDHSAAASAYKARDVVNAPAIKQRIKERSTGRGDAPVSQADDGRGEVRAPGARG